MKSLWVVAAVVGQSCVTLNQRMFVVIGCEKKHGNSYLLSTLGYKRQWNAGDCLTGEVLILLAVLGSAPFQSIPWRYLVSVARSGVHHKVLHLGTATQSRPDSQTRSWCYLYNLKGRQRDCYL